jgi:predicted nucleic acid-binding protein
MAARERVAVDTSLLVGLVDQRDKWHTAGVALREALKTAALEMVYFDCVMNETVSVLARRARERKRTEEFTGLFANLVSTVPQQSITWLSTETERLYPDIMALVRDSDGDLNFHDALIALGSREFEIRWVASFDGDFDLIPWLTRLAAPDHIGDLLEDEGSTIKD